jgi:site-specific DNA-methyltransferase (adenine-specific)
LLVWDKGPGVGGNGNTTLWKRSWELIQIDPHGRGASGARDVAILRYWATSWSGHKLHPTEKPLPLMRYLVEKLTRPGELILDPFMGAGTTLVAARQLGRRAIGIELERRYCDRAIDGLRQGGLFVSD